MTEPSSTSATYSIATSPGRFFSVNREMVLGSSTVSIVVTAPGSPMNPLPFAGPRPIAVVMLPRREMRSASSPVPLSKEKV